MPLFDAAGNIDHVVTGAGADNQRKLTGIQHRPR